jgi:hypothetical protein
MLLDGSNVVRVQERFSEIRWVPMAQRNVEKNSRRLQTQVAINTIVQAVEVYSSTHLRALIWLDLAWGDQLDDVVSHDFLLLCYKEFHHSAVDFNYQLLRSALFQIKRLEIAKLSYRNHTWLNVPYILKLYCTVSCIFRAVPRWCTKPFVSYPASIFFAQKIPELYRSPCMYNCVILSALSFRCQVHGLLFYKSISIIQASCNKYNSECRIIMICPM